MNKDASEWGPLREEWGSDARTSLPNIDAMIGRARQHRRCTLQTIALEWAIAAAALAAIAVQWQRLAEDAIGAATAVLLALVTMFVLGISTWTRWRSLAGPSGASLQAWLAMSQRRALLGLRLARLTRWTVLAMSPLPALALLTGAGNAVSIGIAVMVLAGGWAWAGRRSAQLAAELHEIRALALEWLGQPLPGEV